MPVATCTAPTPTGAVFPCVGCGVMGPRGAAAGTRVPGRGGHCHVIVVAGEALMDVVVDDAGRQALPGGSPFNVAVGLARLGAHVAYLGRLSRDSYGQRLLAQLVGEGVAVHAVQRGDEPTATAEVSVGPGGGARYRFEWTGTADRLLDANAVPPMGPEVRALHVGSVSLALQPAATALEAVVARERQGRLLSLDPNIRPELVTDPAGYRLRLQRLRRMSDLIKASDEDIAWLRPGADPAAIAREWVADGAAAVVVTRGGRGALAVTATAEVVVPVPEVRVVDTVGAGDALMAGWLAGLVEHDALSPSALRAADAALLGEVGGFAAQVAALTCGRRGADPPRRDELS